MLLRQIFDPGLSQYAYLIGCQKTREALIIDPQRDIDRYRQIAASEGVRIVAAAETHIHADFVSGVSEFANDPTVQIYLSGEGGSEWSYRWPGNRRLTNLLKHLDHFMVGNIKLQALHTPGHTPEHISFLITDEGGNADQPMALISGDFLFVGDVGRPDLLEAAAGVKNAMEPSAQILQQSLSERLIEFQDYLQILPAHGAGSSCGKALGAVPSTTLGYERRFNGALKLALSDGPAFVKEILHGQPDPPLYFARMKQVNRDGIQVTGGAPKVARLSAEKFLELADGTNVKILDARNNRAEFDAAHIHGAINAPSRSNFFSISAGSYLAAEDKILLVLEDSSEADLAILQLYRIGFDNLIGWTTLAELKAANLLTGSVKRMMFADFDSANALKDGEIIDARTTAEFEKGHLKDAKSIPYTRIKARLEELPKNRKLYVHCGSGLRAAFAASFLSSEGFDVVHVDGNYSAA